MQISSLEEMEEIAARFVKTLMSKRDTALIVGLYGELGSGKTTFTQKVARSLGVEKAVTSPTFVILKNYKLTGQKFDSLIHIDAYRLESSSELDKLDWQRYVTNPKNLIVIEWPENVEEILPNNIVKIPFTFVNETTREIVLPNE